MKILVVDDSRTMRKILKKTILAANVDEVVEAEDGLDALKKLKDETGIDMILMDINMPNVNGVQALQEIKKIPAIKDIPVVMCTSEAEKEMVIECIKSGAKDYIVKPFSKEIIIDKIDKILG